jgi:hypothetical protein
MKNSWEKDQLNNLFPVSNMEFEKIPFPKDEVIILVDQLVRLHSIQIADEESNKEIKEAMKTLNEALRLIIRSPRIIIGGNKNER